MDSYTSNATIILTVAWIIIIIVPSFLTVVVVSISGTLSVLRLLTDRNYMRTTSADGGNKLIEERSYATVTVMILTAKCIMANTPKAVFFTFLFSNVQENIGRADEKIHFELVFALNMLVIISSFLNPVVYCVRLRDVRLSGVRLSGVRPSGVRLRGFRLSGARLSGFRLRGVRLRGARLSGARLSGVRLRGARLSGFTLRGARLSGFRLRGVRLNNNFKRTRG